MKTLILGSSGQTGSYLGPILRNSEYEVVGASRNLAADEASDSAHYLLDVRNAKEFKFIIEAENPDAIINLSSLSSVSECEARPTLSEEVNFLAVVNMAKIISAHQAVAEKPIHFIQASSSEMYAGLGSGVLINELSNLAPLSVYGKHKAMTHQYLDSIASEFPITQAILFNHESSKRPEKFVSQKIIKNVVDLYLGNISQIPFGNLKTRRDWSFAGDVAQALSEMLKLGSTGSFVIGSGVLHSVEDFFLAACDLIGIPNGLNFAYQDSTLVRKVENDGLIADTTKARGELLWKPKFQFREIVLEMLKSKCEREGIDISL